MIVSRTQLVLFCALLHYRVESQQEVLIEESLEVESVQGPTGGRVELPCDVSPALAADRVGLVIWYKQGHETPIYSLDAREGISSQWSDPATLGNRATFRTNTTPAVLMLTKLRPEDSGQYRCRVDFIKSPTKNTRLNLTVLIPPDRLIVLNESNDEVHGSILGPYDEGAEVNLTCIAVGGRPIARISWWKSHALLANSESRASVSLTLHRPDFGTEITCQAVTDPSIPPLSHRLSIDMNLPPLSVRIQGGKRPLVAGQTSELSCQVVGARPKPVITWWKGGTKLNTVRDTTSMDGNITVSVLTFVPAIEDAGRVLSCRATQPAVSHTTREDGWKLEIQHLPVVTLKFGANIDANKVIEGSDIYLDCRVRANPWYSNVHFTRNGLTVKAGPGVLLANQSLVLQHVSRQAAGAYVCAATNALGDGMSTPLLLDVKYAPSCKSEQTINIRAARGEVLEIQCDVDSNPKVPVTYQWWFNSTTHSRRELKTSTQVQKGGTYSYTINSSSDYGWLQCLASNTVGSQTKPCVYHILPAERPSTVRHCDVKNITYDSLIITCAPGHDGGLRQTFVLEVFDKATGVLLRNISNEESNFEVPGLSSTEISIAIRSYNAKGSSDAFTLTCSLLQYPERRTGQVPVKVELTTLLITVLIAVAIITIMATLSAAVCYCKYCNQREEHGKKNKRTREESSDVLLTSEKKTESADSLDKNPDIIPLNTKLSDSCSNKSSATDYSSVRPLISTTNLEEFEVPTRFSGQHPMSYQFEHPLKYRVPNFQPNLAPMPNIGTNVYRHHHNVYEDWLRYKNALPLDSSHLLPLEQLRPPDEYLPPPVLSDLYRNPIPQYPQGTHFQELDHGYHNDNRQMSSQINSESPSVRVHSENNSAYFNKFGTTSTLPRLKVMPTNLPKEKIEAPKSTETEMNSREN
ncbi:PREDICTED: nephrin-like isoform X2 [Papilio xuthus]|uniref:Nephrin-like isoform X2 n=1 Tax=Papilio xuthus TaxID=66420 RepID=A0AAJ6ZT36_PAPXU|nr:PREDICTED: nephrin-like isoform X2 [Papilio xuthus]